MLDLVRPVGQTVGRSVYTIRSSDRPVGPTGLSDSVIFVNENENENYQKRKNNDFVNEN